MTALTGRDFARYTFDDIVEAGIAFLREELPEFRETDPRDPLIALIRFVAFIGHREAALDDLIASELSWPTLQRRRSAIAWATLIGQELLADSPAAADVLLDLIGVPGPADVIVPERALFRTIGDADSPSVAYENQDGDVTVGNLEFTLIAEDGGVFSAPSVASIATPWGGGAPAPDDAVYIGHAVLQFDQTDIALGGSPADYVARFEYRDGRFRRVAPDEGGVAASGSGIRMILSGLIGTTEDHSGLIIHVIHKTTGVAEQIPLIVSGGIPVIVTATKLGQASVSTNASDYEVSADWLPWGDNEDDSSPSNFTATATLPQDAGHKWQTTAINGVTAYWVRERVITVGGGGAAPSSLGATPTADITWTLLVAVLQGQTVVDVLGTTTGQAFDRLPLNESPFVEGSTSVLDVAGDTEWEEVVSLFGSGAGDKHFTVQERPDETIEVVFGDGVNGFLPATGQLVTSTYRIGADENGNVGALAIAVADAAITFATNVRNPRDAFGWRRRQGTTEADLDRLRFILPGTFRAGNRAVTPDDIATLAVQEFETSDGRRPFARCVSIEQGAGFKSVKAVCVGAAGAVPTAADLAELDTFFNGTTVGFQRFGGVALSNQRVVSSAYTPKTVDVNVTITVARRFARQASDSTEAAIRATVSPLAADTDGVFLWVPGSSMNEAALVSAIGAIGIQGLVDVAFSSPTFPVTFAQTELPLLGTLAITVVEL